MEDQVKTLETTVAEEISKILIAIENGAAAGIKSDNLKFAKDTLDKMINDKSLNDYYLETLYYTSLC